MADVSWALIGSLLTENCNLGLIRVKEDGGGRVGVTVMGGGG